MKIIPTYEEFIFESIILGSEIIAKNSGLSKSEDGSAFIDKNQKFNLQTIKLSDVNNKGIYSWYVKRGLDEDVAMIDHLINKIKAGIILHPIVLDKNMKILDGNHRFVAYRKLGHKEIKAYIEI
jgi:hypothetical protein